MARTLLLYGNSRTWKTSNCGYAAEYLYEKSGGKPVRLVSADKGDPLGPLATLIRRGIVVPFLLEVDKSDTAKDVGETGVYPIKYAPSLFSKLVTGYWPTKLSQDGRMEADGSGRDFIAPGVGNELANVSGYIFEGLTSFADVLFEHIVHEGRKINEDVVSKFSVTMPGQQEEKFGSVSRGHYNWVQKEVLTLLRKMKNLPVERVIITAHEAEGKDDDTLKPVRGPAIAGKAVTSRVLRDVGTCIHAESYDQKLKVTQDGVEVEVLRSKVRYFFESHSDPIYSNTPYLAGPRIPPERISELRAKWPASFFTPGLGYKTGGLDEYLRVEDELVSRLERLEALEATGAQAKERSGQK